MAIEDIFIRTTQNLGVSIDTFIIIGLLGVILILLGSDFKTGIMMGFFLCAVTLIGFVTLGVATSAILIVMFIFLILLALSIYTSYINTGVGF